ncbi:maleylpyruvate isomerase family mycothiol-dependent enzyme [Asanoa sp. WMMD1127]|uniref:maleylpyruvate isomerase family mycothiol-dependent enzyme n=1 Tax=Asanoa sp. WMMD1127 TaxID=3016107 RepID=UPI002416135D|nr:maleylpyruvate isomerase family mycothiol-dependent enzyme [Asanoa sp. WMMD1127]MDG4820476.1 maleylpyruvate isomerase family mycothiol-dependent enzyme [Asanoa sp. WMMD1127]
MVTDTRPHALTRRQAADIAATELRAFGAAMASLDDTDWVRATDCSEWTVKDVVAHVCGQYEEIAKPTVLLRRLRVAKRRYPDRTALDGHNQVQLDDLGKLSPRALFDRLARLGPVAIRRARLMPGLFRRISTDRFFPDGPTMVEANLGYLVDVILPRDTWMHRLELARATGRVFDVDDHDYEIVGQVVRDLDRAWQRPPLRLELTGPAGGLWELGDGPPVESVTADTMAMMLHLSGRDGVDLPKDSPLEAARVVF